VSPPPIPKLNGSIPGNEVCNCGAPVVVEFRAPTLGTDEPKAEENPGIGALLGALRPEKLVPPVPPATAIEARNGFAPPNAPVG